MNKVNLAIKSLSFLVVLNKKLILNFFSRIDSLLIHLDPYRSPDYDEIRLRIFNAHSKLLNDYQGLI